MVAMLGAVGEIGGRRETRKRLEVMIEMRLVIIATGKSEIGPNHWLACLEMVEYGLKACDAEKKLGGQANRCAEEVGEAPRAEVELFGDIGDGWAVCPLLQ